MTAHRTPLSCPRCAAHPGASSERPLPLFADTVGGVTLHACGACGGVFLGTACAQRLAAALPGDAIRRAADTARGARYQASTAEPLACPMCGRAMERTRATRAGVDLDVCGEHGTWYDSNELSRVAEAVGATGWHAGPPGVAAAGTVPTAAVIRSGRARRRPEESSGVADVALAVVSDATLEVGADVVLNGVLGILGGIFD